MGSKPNVTKKVVRGDSAARKEQVSLGEETRFLFLGTKVLDEMKILARLAAPAKGAVGKI